MQKTIADLLDEELYAGVPELLDGQTVYQTQVSQRKSFAVDLINGRFLDALPGPILLDLADEYSLYTGVPRWGLQNIVTEVNLAFRQNSTPGSWNNEGQIRLVPGIDFDPLIWAPRMDLRDWLAYEEE
jgi:hypothetical protein